MNPKTTSAFTYSEDQDLVAMETRTRNHAEKPPQEPNTHLPRSSRGQTAHPGPILAAQTTRKRSPQHRNPGRTPAGTTLVAPQGIHPAPDRAERTHSTYRGQAVGP